jgi:hypothetical protein
MNFHICNQLFLFLTLLKFISYGHSASSPSVFPASVKHKNPKLDKTVTNRKSKGGNDDDSDGSDDDGSKFVSLITSMCSY